MLRFGVDANKFRISVAREGSSYVVIIFSKLLILIELGNRS